MNTSTTLSRLALVVALCCSGLVQAQVGGSSTQLGASITEDFQRAMGWSAGKPAHNGAGRGSPKAGDRLSQLKQAGAERWHAFAEQMSAATLRLRKSLHSAAG